MDLHPDIEIELIFDDKELDLSTREADVAIRMRRPKQLNLIRKNLLILIIIFMVQAITYKKMDIQKL